MSPKKVLTIGVLVMLVLALTSCDVPSKVTCTLRYRCDNGNVTEDRTDPRAGGRYYSVPLTGGKVTLQVGGYVEAKFGMQDWHDLNQFLASLRKSGIDLRIRELTHIRVDVRDRDNPAAVLYAFDGNMLDFISQPGVKVIFAGSRSVLVEIEKNLPATSKAVWWMGKVEVNAGGREGHADMYLIQGGLNRYITENGHY